MTGNILVKVQCGRFVKCQTNSYQFMLTNFSSDGFLFTDQCKVKVFPTENFNVEYLEP